jgi:hypothetical protein
MCVYVCLCLQNHNFISCIRAAIYLKLNVGFQKKIYYVKTMKD